jgi:hypothetical protein
VTLLDACVKNGGPTFHAAAGTQDAAGCAAALAALASGRGGCAEPEPTAAAAALLRDLARAFALQADVLPFTRQYEALVAQGVRFPETNEERDEQGPVYPPPRPAAASPVLTAARAASALGPAPAQTFGLPPGLSAGRRPAAQQDHGPTPGTLGRQGAPLYYAPPMGYPGYPAHGAGHAGAPNLPHQQYPYQHQQPPLPFQLAALNSAFARLRTDLTAVRVRVATAARLAQAGLTGSRPTAGEWLDAVDICDAAVERLRPLIELGVAGVLDETLFEECLAVHEGAARVAEVGRGDLRAASAGQYETAPGGEDGVKYPQLDDLITFDAPPCSRAASGGGAVVVGAAAGVLVASVDDLIGTGAVAAAAPIGLDDFGPSPAAVGSVQSEIDDLLAA